MKKFKFIELKKFLEKNNQFVNSAIDENEIFNGINSLNLSSENEISFFHNSKYQNLLSSTKAKACFITDSNQKLLPSTCYPIIVDDPYASFALCTNFLYPKLKSNNIISPKSNISKNCILGKNIQIDSNVIIKENTEIGNNCIINDNCVIGPDVKIGNDTTICSNSVISNTNLGNNCLIKSGAIIGGKGFGFTPKNKIEVIHIGNVSIGNNVEVGSNTTIDKSALESTYIGDNTRIDNLVQIAHGVKIGNNSIIAAQCGISGSTIIGQNCIMGGQVGIAGHLKIGDNVKIAAKSGVTKDIKDNSTIAGFPATDIRLWKKSIIFQRKNQ